MFGKLIGGLLGLVAGGFFGAIIGLLIGHFFDRGMSNLARFDFSGERERLRQLFFETAFQLMGHLAKSDGRISEAEISQAEVLMSRLALSDDHRRRAIALFKQGAAADFQPEPLLARFVEAGGKRFQLPLFLLEFLITMALADGELHDSERVILLQVATSLGISGRQFEQLLAMLLAQEQFAGQDYQQGFNRQARPSPDTLSAAYRALGVEPDISDGELKKAWRKLMSQHHPDKLIARGVPDDMVRVATEKSQQIQQAYETIKKARQS